MGVVRQVIWISASLLAFIVTIVFNYLSTTGGFGTPDQAELSDKYNVPITPPGFVFSVWGLIYIWQAFWLFYVLIQTYMNFNELQTRDVLIFNVPFYLSWIASDVFNALWVVLFGFEYITLSSITLILIAAALYFNAYANTKYLAEVSETANAPRQNQSDVEYFESTPYPPFLLSSKRARTGLYITVNNGIAFYAGWVSVASCLGIALFLAFPCNVDQYVASWVALSVLTVVLLVYLFLDFVYFRISLIHTYTPYAVLVWALAGILTRDDLKGLEILLYILLAICGLALIAKIVSGILYHIKQRQEAQVNDTGYSNMGV